MREELDYFMKNATIWDVLAGLGFVAICFISVFLGAFIYED